MKVERVSYDVMTPSAARGILEAILWKPAIRWVVQRIDVLMPIRWESVRRNEVGATMSPRSPCLFVEDQRQQRAGLLLRDVDYVIHGRFELTERAGPEDNVIKFQDIFLRRASNGQCFHRPYLGCREFAAYFQPITNGEPLPEPVEKTPELGFGQPRDLGWMLHDVEHDPSRDAGHVHSCTELCRPLFFKAHLDRGRMLVPPPGGKEVRG
jgi:CRISPR-associated protein Cas5d